MSTGWLIQSFSSTSVMVARHRGSGCNNQQIINMRSNKNNNNYFTWLWCSLEQFSICKTKTIHFLTSQSQRTHANVNLLFNIKVKTALWSLILLCTTINLTLKIKSSANRRHLNKTRKKSIYNNYFAFEPVRHLFLFHKCSYQRSVWCTCRLHFL